MYDTQPIEVRIPSSHWPDEIANGLFLQWCLKFAQDELGIQQWSGGNGTNNPHVFGIPTGCHFTVTLSDARSWHATGNDIDQSTLRSILTRAAQNASEMHTGDDLVYQASFTSSPPSITDPSFTLNMARIMGEQVRIAGPRRLSDRILLNFKEQSLPDSTPQLFAPDTEIEVTLFTPGPAPLYLANRTASAMFEVAAAICAHAIGRPVDNPMGSAMFTLDGSAADEEISRRRDPRILGLARDSISLDIFGDLAALGGEIELLRARNAFITLHEAQRQTNADAATMLYVCAIESLISPSSDLSWRKESVTRRFREGVISLCGDSVDSLLAHPNMESALGFHKRGGIGRQRREIVDHIYDLRSLPTHTGMGPTRVGIIDFASEHGMRIALLSELAKAALHGYLQAPRSFLAGHRE
jgi:hypothetical protein